MVYHLRYLECWDGAVQMVLREPGPLPPVWRSYITIMAAAQVSTSTRILG